MHCASRRSATNARAEALRSRALPAASSAAARLAVRCSSRAKVAGESVSRPDPAYDRP